MPSQRDTDQASPPDYHAYLIRIWREGPRAPWRASLTHVGTGAVQRFASPQMVWAYLQLRLEVPSNDEIAPGPD